MSQTNLFEDLPAPAPRRGAGLRRWLIGILALALVAVAVAVCWNVWRLGQESQALERRRQATAQGKELVLGLQEAGLCRRAYVLTGDRAYLNYYLKMLPEVNTQLNRFQWYSGDLWALKPRLAGLGYSIRELVRQWQNSLTHYQLQPKDTSQHALLTRQAGELQERVRAEIEQLRAAQDRWLKAQRAAQAARVGNTFNLAAAEGALALALAAAGFLGWRREEPILIHRQ